MEVSFTKDSARQESEELQLEVSHLDLLEPMEEADLQELLANGSLTASTSKRKTLKEMKKFKHVMKAIGKHSGFATAEQVENSSYLCAKYLGRHPVALLLKMNEGERKLIVDGKAANGQVLSKVMKDLSDILN